MMKHPHQNIDARDLAGTFAHKLSRNFLLLPGLLVLSAILHLSAFLIWPISIAPPSIGLRQLTLEIQRPNPPGAPSVSQATNAPASAHITNTALPASRLLAKTIIRTTEALQVKQQSSKTRKSMHDAQQTRKLSRVQLEEKLHGRIQQALLPHFNYPSIARRRGWEGTVRISLRVEDDGRLTNLQVVENCKFSALNRAALHSLQQVSGIPAAKQWLAGRHMDMVLPIQYLLLDS